MSINDIVKSQGFGDWSRWFLAYVLTSISLTLTGVWYLSGYSHDLTNELRGIHEYEKASNHKLDIILGIPGETPGLLPPLIAKADSISQEQDRVKNHLTEEDTQRKELSDKLDNLIRTTGNNNPILNRIEKRLNPPQGPGQ